MHIAMESLTQATILSQSRQGTAEDQLLTANKDLVGTSDQLGHNNNAEESPSTPQVNELISELGRSQALSEGSTGITAVLGKRKGQTDDSQNQTPLPGPPTFAQSELQDIVARPVAKLPAGHKSRRSQHTIKPIPKQTISVGHPLRDPGLKIVDQVVRDAASHALHFMKDPPKPLVDWTDSKNTNDQDSDGIHRPHLDIDPHKEETVSSADVVTILDHEPDTRPRLTMNPPMWAHVRLRIPGHYFHNTDPDYSLARKYASLSIGSVAIKGDSAIYSEIGMTNE
jgi:hypothetical protein